MQKVQVAGDVSSGILPFAFREQLDVKAHAYMPKEFDYEGQKYFGWDVYDFKKGTKGKTIMVFQALVDRLSSEAVLSSKELAEHKQNFQDIVAKAVAHATKKGFGRIFKSKAQKKVESKFAQVFKLIEKREADLKKTEETKLFNEETRKDLKVMLPVVEKKEEAAVEPAPASAPAPAVEEKPAA